jgi:hypothetical protein
MSYSQGPESVESIDQVIQSGHTLSAQAGIRRDNGSNLSINRTAPLPPLSPSSRSPRRDHIASNGQSNSLAGPGTGRGGSSGGSRNASVRRSDEESVSSRAGTGTATTVSSSGNANNMADFFSSEVFNIVIHNPTTAHRFLRFCQSRACGENIEFLQKVGCNFILLAVSSFRLSTTSFRTHCIHWLIAHK